MNTMKRLSLLVPALILILAAVMIRCSGPKKTTEDGDARIIETNVNGTGLQIRLDFSRGSAHNHPLMAIWIEDTTGKYIETLFVAESIGKGLFRHADQSKGQWEPGPVRRPAALPYWGHQRGVRAADGLFLPTPDDPMPDAVTGPTPAGDFTLNARAGEESLSPFNIMFEINQSWDWNKYWTNNKYPDDPQYKTSSQPAVVYSVRIDPQSDRTTYEMKPVGHSHYAGRDGNLYPDLSTLTTALEIAKHITVTIRRP